MTDSRSWRDQQTGTLASDMPTRSLDPTAPDATAPAAPAASLEAGRQFGSYRILRLLGRGGMGEVHEAEDIASGRRVALKVLNRTLGDHDRSRFLREGRLAAALSHPHTVYVYGTEEIAGVPVITMELATGGTLKDRIHDRGPLAAREAVDLTRQIIAGLDAAARAGVLHRDVKPSNCFLDRDGRVKVGDFGLSISQLTADETHLTIAGTVLGTPAFASPEQLRGGKLDVASDIYSVGATLYYLLTGRAPFEEANLVTLVANVLQDPPVPPSDRQAGVSRDLSAVVLRALAKSPADRFPSYDAFDAALRPFSSEAPAPASYGPRFIASAIDTILINIGLMTVQFGALGGAVLQSRRFVLLSGVISFVANLAYYTWLESTWGASIGKRLIGLQVISADGARARARQILIRTAIFLVVMQLPQQVFMLVAGPDFFLRQQGLAVAGSQLIVPTLLAISLSILFGRARAANGYAALHDVISATRVIVRRSATARAARRTAGPAAMKAHTARLGPYAVPADAISTPGAVIAGTDDALHRPVWIRIAAADEPPVAAERRDLDRAARLRWLGGHRGSDPGWDAFEAPDGQPLIVAHTVSTAEWRHLLLQLASEIDAALKYRDLPQFSLARVWITEHGDVRVLDFVPPLAGIDLAAADAPIEDWQEFLYRAAVQLMQRPVDRDAAGTVLDPHPLFVSRFVERLASRSFATPAAAAAELAAIGDRPLGVTRARRAGQLAQLGALPMFVMACFLIFLVLIARLSDRYPDLELMRDAAQELQRLESLDATPENVARRRALETVVAGRFGARLQDQAFRTAFFPRAFVLQAHGARLERAAAAHPAVTGADLRAAESELEEFITRSRRSSARLRSPRGLATMLPIIAAVMWLAVALPTLVFAPLLRGGLSFRMWGIGVVDRSGREASRPRALARALLAWLPVVLLVLLAAFGRRVFGSPDVSWAFTATSLSFFTVFLAGVVVAVLTPSRGLQDRLAGTWLVPR